MANPNPTPSFTKGVSGNPGGRPKRAWTWSGLLEEAMDEMVPTKEGPTLAAKAIIIKRITAMAINGDIKALKEIFNRMDGLPHQDLKLTGSLDLTQDPKAMQTLKDTIVAVAEIVKNEQQPA